MDLVKGDTRTRVHVEVVRGGVEIGRLKSTLPDELDALLLLQVPSWPEETYRFLDGASGVPEGETLFGFAYPAGLVIGTPDGVEYPLADDPAMSFFEGRALAEVEADVATRARRN